MQLHDNGAFYSACLDDSDTYRWANRPGALWPCSTLAGSSLFVQIDKGTGDLVDTDAGEDVDGHELSALIDDLVVPAAIARGWADETHYWTR